MSPAVIENHLQDCICPTFYSICYFWIGIPKQIVTKQLRNYTWNKRQSHSRNIGKWNCLPLYVMGQLAMIWFCVSCLPKQNSLSPPEDQVPNGGERGKTQQGDRNRPWFCPPLLGLLKSSLLLLHPLMPFVYQSFNLEYSRTRLFLRVLLRRGSPNSKVRTVSRKPSQSRTVSSSGLWSKARASFILKEIF